MTLKFRLITGISCDQKYLYTFLLKYAVLIEPILSRKVEKICLSSTDSNRRDLYFASDGDLSKLFMATPNGYD